MDLVLNVVERKTGGLSCGGGISSQGHSEGALPGFIGSASFSQRNLFGLNQKLAATVEIGQVQSLCCTSLLNGRTGNICAAHGATLPTIFPCQTYGS